MATLDIISKGLKKLEQTDNNKFWGLLQPLLIANEEILASFKAVNDGIIFTNKRIIGVDVSGIAGQKEKATTIPYKKIDMFFIETAGMGDLDTELEIWVAGELIHLNFSKKVDIHQIGQLLSTYIL
ncbi:PH domain-containing protein [Candidatus Epulonipiscium viviparus]|uniref:PH domain-containing protein n=1 Tax=Candidatus Epulonipiscium viviparus TaxID=420336 RepID=UPI00016C002D|nr:PH domain-containing protein [Candidatus Epulopiscium viviparus]